MFSKFFKKQNMMRTVLIAVSPIIIYGIYVFGWRTLALLVFNIIVACTVEYLSEKYMYKKAQITEAAIVTAILFTLTLSPGLPFWMSGVGVAFGIFFGKEVFGGFGKNVFNPAIVGRAFIYINFSTPMLTFNQAANSERLISGLGGFAKWITPVLDHTASPTPLLDLKINGSTVSVLNLFLGNIAGSIGEISTLLIILGGAYMIYKKVASWEIMVSSLIGFVVTSYALILIGVQGDILPPLQGLLVGGFIFGTVFMSTDPISAPKQVQAKWIYGIMIGFTVVIIRGFSLFPGGTMFAILIAEVFAPVIDYIFKEVNRKKRLAKKSTIVKKAVAND
ncbi:RnfABCDGE type electron transport complex subunit D [Helcococcus ovis]|uniref:RnfABCDGE type electron transport complex subunit D n=1 Tax=Helcococcus ovis TaxID=72026 RepID=A0A4R9C1N0_9FIRM|nr:RnfABCDGE type electron transport complex subunit D [Helcococcus ovis]TFF66570.1 RnfABCDGE type electron transport complex subunit D [Helcococcus ovis]TFF68852.1 RnfABCDGE type electron transport complex subunit D [Helcococcus ovis]WNZ00719.1 RnfABCDGE type electron transport complex subunit D [Helcococcus ovis]